MSTALAAYTGSGAVGARTGARDDPGTSRSTAGIPADGRVWTWWDLPAQVQAKHTGQALAEGVHLTPGARLINKVPREQVMEAWRAFPDRVVLVSLVRRLRSLPDGRFAAGGWSVQDTQVLRAGGPVVRTSGTVPPGAVAADDAGGGSGPAVPRAHERAAYVNAFLPAPVRRSVSRAVPSPDVWLGELTQWTEPGKPTRQELMMLRADAMTAVVVKATRASSGNVARASWTVEQVSYPLASSRLQLGKA